MKAIQGKKARHGRQNIKTGRVEKPSGAGIVADALIIIVLILVMAMCIIPLWHVLMASLSDGKQLASSDGLLWLWVDENGEMGGAPNFGGYLKTLQYNDFAILKSYGITIGYVVGNVILGLFINVVAGYILSADTKIAKPLMIFVVITMMLLVAAILMACMNLPISYLCAVLLMDLFNYNEYKGLARLEGTTNQLAHGVSSQLGQGLGGFLLGVFLDLSGFISATDGAAVTQPDSAITMVKMLYSVIPIVILVVLLVCVFFLSKLDKEMPEIEKTLAERREEVK